MIKNIIFDFGGVIYNLDFKLTFNAFEKLGFSDFENMFSQFNADALFQELETGLITPGVFYERIKQVAAQPVTDEQIKNAWNALLLGYRKPSLDFLTALGEQYNLFLLSNTNQIHYEHFAPQLKEQTKYSSLESFFDKAYYSHKIGMRKPDKSTFGFVLNDAGISAADTLFIDDSYTNLPNAESMGIKTHLLQPGELIEHLDYTRY